MPPARDLKQEIIGILKGCCADGMRRCDIRRQITVETHGRSAIFRDAFHELCEEGVIVRHHRGRYALAESAAGVEGTLSVHPRGFGFVTPDDGSSDIFIPPRGLNDAITGDRVLVALRDEQDERGPAGVVRRILQRKHEVLTGRLVDLDGALQVRPLRPGLPAAIPLAVAEGALPPSLQPGAWVVVRLSPQKGARGPLQASLVRALEAGNTVAGDLDAVASEYNLAAAYTKEENDAAAALPPRQLPRENLEQLTIVTIDPEDAKDFDDAISIQPGHSPETVRVGVHIADVAAYIPPGSQFDAAACQRSFTSYLPGRTLPMLPRPISSDRCSLIAQQPRLAHSVFIEVSKETGEIMGSTRTRSVVRVTQRLSFDAVQQYLADGSMPDWPHEVARTLRELAGIAAVMRGFRAENEAFLDLSLPEVRVRCTEDPPRIQGLVREEANTAHALVEEFMLAANVAVAWEMAERQIPGLYRVHDKPKSSDLVEFMHWATEVLGFKTGNLANRGACNRLLRKLKDSPLHDVVAGALLAAMQRAAYAAQPQLHYGLGKECYSHFTSPIRRYPDLLVHQQLMMRDLGEPERTLADCEDLAGHCSAAERNNDEAYRAAVDRLKLRYVQEQKESDSEQFYEGTVARITHDGPLVYVPELGLYGILPGEGAEQKTRRSGRSRPVLAPRRSGKKRKCGDVIYVQVRKADVVRGMLQLQPVQPRI